MARRKNRPMFHPGVLPIQSDKIKQMFRSKSSSIVLDSPYQCAKTFSCMLYLHALHMKIPGLYSIVLRKEKTTVYNSILPQFVDKILPFGFESHPLNPVLPYNGTRTPTWLEYFNGGRMVFGGEDDSGKVLGTEWDVAFYSQCEQADFEFWQKLGRRCNGRRGGWKENGRERGLLLGECNPSYRKHFLKRLQQEGSLEMITVSHADNATLFYHGEWTPLGLQTIEDLKNNLVGIEYRRGFLGEWCSAEGTVYGDYYESEIHDLEEEEIHKRKEEREQDWIWYGGIDYGENHPFVYGLFCGPEDYSEVYLYKEIYKTGLDVDQMRQEIFDLNDRYIPEDEYLQWVVADHRPEVNKALLKTGLPIENADKEVLPGINLVKKRLNANQLFFNKRSREHTADFQQTERNFPTRTTEEFERYVHKDVHKHNGTLRDEIPIPLHDDGLDVVRYVIKKTDYVPYIAISGSISPANNLPDYLLK